MDAGPAPSFGRAESSQGPGGRGASALSLLLGIVLLFSLARYLHDLLKTATEAPFIDFAHYYTYTTAVAIGRDPFDPQAVAGVDAMLHIRRAEAAANYPPLFYLLMRPWVLLPFRSAALAWFLASQIALLAAFALCIRRFRSPDPIRVAAAAFVWLNYQPLIENLALGQANILLLLLVTLAWHALRTGHSWAAGAAVAATAHIKVQYGLLLPLLFWIGRSRVGIRALLLTGIGFGVGWIVLGPDHHITYVRYLLSLPDAFYAWPANVSTRASLYRLFGSLDYGRFFVNGLTWTLDALLVVVFARALPHRTPKDAPTADWAWGLGLVAIPLLSPITEEHHLVVLLLPLTCLILAGPESRWRPRDRILLIASVLLLGSRYSLEAFPAFHRGPLSLLATGKLLGMVGLAWLLTRLLRHSEGTDP